MALRFTPTGVGTTSWRLPAPLPKTVHPHGRGDHATVPISSVIFAGSPPRAWGPPDDPLHEGDVTRFTPTGVGTTLKECSIYGTLTKKSPSKSSIDREVSPQLRILYPCSVLLEWIIKQPPSLAWLHAFSHNLSRTEAGVLPTNTPALGSRNQRVSSPLNDGDTRSSIKTIIGCLQAGFLYGMKTSSTDSSADRVPQFSGSSGILIIHIFVNAGLFWRHQC